MLNDFDKEAGVLVGGRGHELTLGNVRIRFKEPGKNREVLCGSEFDVEAGDHLAEKRGTHLKTRNGFSSILDLVE